MSAVIIDGKQIAADVRADVAAKVAELKEKGVLVRYFNKARLQEYVRITVGAKEEIDALIAATAEISEGSK